MPPFCTDQYDISSALHPDRSFPLKKVSLAESNPCPNNDSRQERKRSWIFIRFAGSEL
jgi:hypothetical protein